MKMHIQDIFKFQDGRTVFMGTLPEGAAPIGKSRGILRGGENYEQNLLIEGEMRPRKTDAGNTLRAVSTLDSVAVTTNDVKSGAWHITICA